MSSSPLGKNLEYDAMLCNLFGKNTVLPDAGNAHTSARRKTLKTLFEGKNFSAIRDYIRENLGKVPEAEQSFLKMRFGLDDGCPYTLAELSEKLDIPVEELRRKEAKALRCIRRAEIKREQGEN